jgi:hypothetical protein
VEVFHHDDEAYARWRSAHPDGYVVNVRTEGQILLHRATCRNLRQTGLAKGRATTTIPKACGTDRAELEDWVRARGRMVLPCTNCEP